MLAKYHTQYTPREYGDYINTNDFDLLYRAQQAKLRRSQNQQNQQKEYNNKQKRLNEYYSVRLPELRDRNMEYYKEALEYINKFI